MTAPAGGTPRPIYAERWYLCRFADFTADEPAWERIPEERRAVVREKFFAKRRADAGSWLLWGPQIPAYQSRSDCEVTIVAPPTHTEGRA